MKIEWDIEDAKYLRLRKALCQELNYQANKRPDETKDHFFRRQTAQWWKAITANAEAREAALALSKQIRDDVNTTIDIQ